MEWKYQCKTVSFGTYIYTHNRKQQILLLLIGGIGCLSLLFNMQRIDLNRIIVYIYVQQCSFACEAIFIHFGCVSRLLFINETVLEIRYNSNNNNNNNNNDTNASNVLCSCNIRIQYLELEFRWFHLEIEWNYVVACHFLVASCCAHVKLPIAHFHCPLKTRFCYCFVLFSSVISIVAVIRLNNASNCTCLFVIVLIAVRKLFCSPLIYSQSTI